MAEMKIALGLVKESRRPGDVEVPVDTDRDGRPNVWVYFEGDKPTFVEGDRFDTGCHDLRVTLATWNVAERYGWETSPPVPIDVDVSPMPARGIFDWVAPSGSLPGGPTRFAELAGRHFPGLADSLRALAEENPADDDLTNKVTEFARQAIDLQPQFLKVHQDRDFGRVLRRPWGHTEQHSGFDLNGDGEGNPEVLVGFAPSGVVRIQFYEKDWRKSRGFIAAVEFEGRAVESVQYQDRRYYAVGDFWVRPDEAIRPALAERYLAPGYHQWRSKHWYAAVRLWQLGTELAALIGDLPIDGKGHPRATPAKWPRGTGFAEAEHGWEFEVDGLPAVALLSVAASLAWMRDDDLTSRLRDLADHATARREYFAALAQYRLLLRFARKLGESTTQANALESMSEIFRHVGNYDLALDCLNESVEIESSLAYARDIVKNVEKLTQDAGNPEAVRKTMQMRSHAMTLNRGCKLGTIAALHADMGNREQAEGYLAESRRLIQSVGDKYCEADLLNLQASWDIADGRWEIAQQRLERVLQMITDEMQAQQQHDRGRKLLEAGQAMHKFIVPGQRTFLEVGMRSRTSPESYRALSATLMAELLLQKSLRTEPSAGERYELLAAAMRWQNQALDWYAKGRDAAGQIVGRLHLASILTHRQEYDAALALNRQVTEEARQVRAFETVWKSLALDGLIHSRLGDLEVAVAAYERAAQEIETVRAGIRSEAVRRGFFSSKLDVYERLASLYDRQRNGKPGDERRRLDLKIWDCMERAKARTLLDMVAGEPLHVRGETVSDALRDNPLLAAQLHGGGSSVLRGDLTSREAHEQFLQQLAKQPELQELASLTTVQPVQLDAVQRELQAGDLLLEYFVTDDDLLVAVISHETLTVHRVAGYGRERIQQDVERYRRVLEQLDPGFEAPAQDLYRRLLQPLLVEFDHVRHLCVVPAGPLHYVPFGAFLLPSGEFVTEKYVLSYAPSASALVYALHRQPKDRAVAESRTLVVAEPAPRLDYGALPGAVIEGERIRNLAPAPKTLLQGLQATETSVISALEATRYFHFAGHTDLPPGGPMRAALLCTQDVDRDGRLEVREIFELDLNACEIAVLSACVTRLGRWSRGDEIVGLERAFLRAGVPTVIASLWKVDDAATSLLMEEFYTNLWQKSLPRADALSQAQWALVHNLDRLGKRRKELTSELTLRGRRGPVSPQPQAFTVETTGTATKRRKVVHPGYWAAFVLSGDWR
ncbi:MAG: CHAT domain-containing protein [Pirellulaceae bacterium]